MNIGPWLREKRQNAGLTQEELAKRMNTAQAVISRYERGERDPTISMLQKIAEALDCELVIEFRPKGQA